MTCKRFVVLVGVFLGSHVPALAQTRAPQIVLAQEPEASTIETQRTVSPPLLTASLLYRDSRKSSAHFPHLFTGSYESDESIKRIPLTEQVKILNFTRSSLPLVQLLSGRLQLGAFQNTLRIQSLEPYPGSPRSVHLSGLCLTFHFGRDAPTNQPIQAWRYLPRIIGAFLN